MWPRPDIQIYSEEGHTSWTPTQPVRSLATNRMCTVKMGFGVLYIVDRFCDMLNNRTGCLVLFCSMGSFATDKLGQDAKGALKCCVSRRLSTQQMKNQLTEESPGDITGGFW